MTQARAVHVPLIGAAVSESPSVERALDSMLAEALTPLAGSSVDLAIVFASPHHSDDYEELLADLQERVHARCLVGCMAEGVLGAGVEVEERPGVALWLAHLPRVEIAPMHLVFRREDGRGVVHGLEQAPEDGSVMLLLADPFTFPVDRFLEELGRMSPSVPVVGGMASGATAQGNTRLFFQGRVEREGAVGAVLSGEVAVATIVSQGCRAVGGTYRVTRVEGNVLYELDGAPAMRRLEEVYAAASEQERSLIREGLHLGIAVGSEFVNRNLIGADPSTGALAVAEAVEEGTAARFQVRDAASADEDLRLLLGGQRLLASAPPAGALLFSCNGRGRRLFGTPHHDVAAFERAFGPIPVAGFFAQGELGPVGGANFLHGFTASLALFLRPDRPL
jgi:small ligand-binding sensory domain FIST